MRKKIIAILSTVILTCGMMAGCGTAEQQQESSVSSESTVQTEQTTQIETVPVTEEVAVETTETTAQTDINVAVLKGPTAMGMVKLMDDSDHGDTGANNYQFTIAASADEITPQLVQGNLDIAAVPANLAAVLYNKDGVDVQVLAVNTLGVLYIVENGDSVQQVEDLRGKTIYASGKGSTPEYALNYMLTSNGINPDTDVTIEWKTEHAECVAALSANENAIALLPQPFVTVAQTQNEGIRIALDLTKEWENAASEDGTKATLITGVVIARTDFVQENPEAVDTFLQQYQASVSYVNDNTQEAAELIGGYDIVTAQVAQKALPYCNITFIAGAEMQEKLGSYLDILFSQNPEAVGGAVPDEKFYYQGANAQ